MKRNGMNIFRLLEEIAAHRAARQEQRMLLRESRRIGNTKRVREYGNQMRTLSRSERSAKAALRKETK